MFMEKWLAKKTGKTIKSNNISDWRRAVCGDLTSVFRPYNGEENLSPEALKREAVITSIVNAKNKPPQTGPTALNTEEVAKINKFQSFAAQQSELLPHQEPGFKPACALPYNLNVDADLIANQLQLSFQSEKTLFGSDTETIGAPFTINSIGKYKGLNGKTWAYAVKAGDFLKDTFKLTDFDNSTYSLAVTGPNGFFRQFKGDSGNPKINIKVYAEKKGIFAKKLNGNLIVALENTGTEHLNLLISDNKYKTPGKRILLKPNVKTTVSFDLAKNGNWYDLSVTTEGKSNFLQRYAGKIETGKVTITDPFMASVS
jgi:phospholipase C